VYAEEKAADLTYFDGQDTKAICGHERANLTRAVAGYTAYIFGFLLVVVGLVAGPARAHPEALFARTACALHW